MCGDHDLVQLFFMAFVMLLFLLFADPIVSIFTDQAEVVKYAVQSLRIIGSGYIFME